MSPRAIVSSPPVTTHGVWEWQTSQFVLRLLDFLLFYWNHTFVPPLCLQIDPTSEHMAAKAAPAQDTVCRSDVCALWNCMTTDEMSLHMFNYPNIVIESLLSHLPLVSHPLLLETLKKTLHRYVVNHITLLWLIAFCTWNYYVLPRIREKSLC